jgi:hypothetical protein
LASNTQLNIAVLDPDTYKQSLITYLSGLPQYSGYNFQGENWNVLLDVLSRNTFLRGFYTNMAVAETSLRTAKLRDNIVSRATELGYIPSSMSSSTTSANLAIVTNGLQNFTIPAGTRFNGLNSNGNFVFTTSNVYFQTSSTGNYNFNNVQLFEGTYTTDVFNVDYSVDNQLFTLSNPTIDTSSLKVNVVQDNGANVTTYQQATNLFGLEANSTVYFLQGTANSQYQIYFGDDVLSFLPQDGAIVSATYRVCSGPGADGISAFGLLDNLGAINGGVVNSVSITPNDLSSGGANAESTASIKLNAPLSRQAQERAVTSVDYRTLILNEFPAVGDCYAYGGGVTANSVQFGYVLIPAVTVAGNPLTQTLKNQILGFLGNIDTIHPFTQITDANTLFVDVSSNVHVNFNLTTNEPDLFQTEVINTIASFSNTNLQKFNTPLRLSQLSTQIGYVDNTAIISNETTLQIKRSIPLLFNTNNALAFSFSNPVSNVSSDLFIANNETTFITDNIGSLANGTLFIVTLNASNNIVNFNPIGTINYSNGSVNIPLLNPQGLSSTNTSAFFVYATPQGKDVYGGQNDIIKIDTVSGITVNIANN